MATILNSFQTFFHTFVLPEHNNPAFFRRWLDNLRNLETQLIVAPGKGTPVEDRRNTWMDEREQWYNIRWPKNAMAEPYWKDRELEFLLENHWLGIGTTWWDWINRQSVGVGFDFDEITSHAPGTGIELEQLEKVRQAACALPYVDVIRSTGGKGLHLYVWFAEDSRPLTANHSEHAAIARVILGKLSTDAQFDFGSHLDVCGGNMWVAHQKMYGTQGFTQLKEATEYLTRDDISPNWRDQIPVVQGKATKVRVIGVTDEGEDIDDQDPLTELTTAHPKVPLDATHRRIIQDLEATGASCVWVPDHHLLQTHTCALKAVSDQWTERGQPMRGFFETLSPGRDMSTCNCFLIPKNDGAFLVFRFGQGTVEHDLWQQDRQGWTYISYNKRPDLQSAALAFSGSELENNKGFHFDQTADAQKAVESLGSKLLLPPGNNYLDRAVTLRKNTDGRLVVELERRDSDSGFDGWNGSKKNKWIKIFNIVVEANSEEDDYTRYDTLIRSCRTPGAADAGWRVHIKEGGWVKHPRENVASVLSLVAPPGLALTQILGKAIINQWLLVCKPFHPEYPGGRQWNLGAPQLVYKPAQLESDEMPQHPHWDRVLGHCGEHLTPVIRETAWCRDWGIFNGKDYLTAWVSCLLKEPFEPLPYLFMYGPQNSGKSIFHEAVSLLVTGGVVKADRALTSPSDFNGELANAVIGVIDEVNIAKSGSTVYNKIKEWTTSQYISIHAKYQQVYQQRNCLHFVQTANSRDSCPIFPGDTRITAMYVAPLVEEIPKPALMQALESEATHFMATLMDATYPSSGTRLRLPILDTAGKEQAADANRDPLEEFLAETCHYVPGAKVPYKEFSDRFFETLTPIEQTHWDRRRLRQSIPEDFPVGLSTKGRTFVGNMSWEAELYPSDAIPYTIKGRCLCLEEKAC